MARRLWLDAAHHALMTTRAQSAFPHECCGLLIGSQTANGWRLTDALDSPNVTDGDPKRQFEIDPRLILSTQRTLRGTNQGIIGLYHSHPNGLAAPSRADHAQAWQSGWLWIILGLGDGKDPVTRAFVHVSNSAEGLAVFEEIDLQVASDPC